MKLFKNHIKENILSLSKLLFFSLTLNLLSAQTQNIRFEKISVNQGVSQTSITSGLQDSEGFIWFGTQDGLNRYNGYSFKTFRNIPFDTTSISDNWIQYIYQDKNGNLWVGSHSGGVSKFIAESETFENIPVEELSSSQVWSIAEDENYILIGTATGLDRMSKTSGKIENIELSGKFNSGDRRIAVNSIFVENDFYWVGTWGQGLLKINRNDISIQTIDLSVVNGNRNLNKVKTIYKKGNLFYLGTYAGLAIYNPETGSVKQINFLPADIINEPVYSITSDEKNNLWVGTHHNGVLYINEKENRFLNFHHDETNPMGIPDDWVMSIFEDRSGIIWFGTGTGACKMVPNKQKFYNYNRFTTKGKFGDYEVKTIFQDMEGTIWIGTWDEGLFKVDLKNNKFTNYRKSDGTGLTNNTIWKIYEDKSKNLWIGTYNGLLKFDRKNNRFLPALPPEYSTNLLVYSNVSEIYEDSFGLLWIGTWGNGLYSFNRFTNEYKVYRQDQNDDKSISSNLITSVIEDRDKSLWIGTGGGGLNLFKRTTKNFQRFYSNSKDSNSLSNNHVRCLYPDELGYLWIGSWGGGVSRYNKRTKSFKHFTEKEGLSNNMVFGIIPDSRGNLWISTNGGVSKLDVVSEKIIKYEKEDGLLSNQFSNGFFRLENRDIAFGGIKGFMIFNPDSILVNNTIPEVKITSFKVFGKEINPEKYLNGKPIELNYNENYFSVGFAALEYTSPEKNEYSYKLEGLDKKWTFNEHKREAYYTDLSPGKYVFHVRASNSDDVWNNKGLELSITIIPPFWRTSWFIGLVLVIIGIFAVAYYRIRIYNIRKQNEKLERLVKERTAEIRNEIYTHQVTENALREIVETRDKFFSIIAHDLRSPFSSILGHAEWLKEDFENFTHDELKQSLARIYDGLKKVFKLTEDLLEWSRIQLGKMEFSQDEFSLHDAVEDVISLVHFNAKKKQISLKNNIIEDVRVFADRRMIQTAIQNLVTNSIKFTKDNGNVIISAKPNGKLVNIIVEDDGVGMSHDVLENLFRIDVRHTTLGTAHEKGTGLGLIISKELIEKNKGSIQVESEPARGTRFIISIPKKK